MGDRWNDERDRDRRERDWRRTDPYARGRGEPTDYRSEAREDRSWQTAEDYGDYSSADFADRYGDDRSQSNSGYGAGRYGRPNERAADRYYEQQQRDPVYREGYMQGGTDYGPAQGGYGVPAGDNRPGRFSNFGFGHDVRSDGPSDRSYRGYATNYDQRAYDNRREALYDREQAGEPRGFLDRAADQVASWFGGGREGERHAGGHRGRGPKGYRRSDARINEDVHDRLTDDPWLDASEIDVTVANGEVTLSGTVADREAKHRAERCVEHVPGVDHVQNNLRIGQVQGSKPFESGNPLTSPGRGFGDSVLDAQARGETPVTDDKRDNH